MIHFLRDEHNNTIIETECWIKSENREDFIELSSTVDIMYYSSHLLSIKNEDDRLRLIATISNLNQLRGWLWEVYFMNKRNDPAEKDDVDKKITEFYTAASEFLGLTYITD